MTYYTVTYSNSSVDFLEWLRLLAFVQDLFLNGWMEVTITKKIK